MPRLANAILENPNQCDSHFLVSILGGFADVASCWLSEEQRTRFRIPKNAPRSTEKHTIGNGNLNVELTDLQSRFSLAEANPFKTLPSYFVPFRTVWAYLGERLPKKYNSIGRRPILLTIHSRSHHSVRLSHTLQYGNGLHDCKQVFWHSCWKSYMKAGQQVSHQAVIQASSPACFQGGWQSRWIRDYRSGEHQRGSVQIHACRASVNVVGGAGTSSHSCRLRYSTIFFGVGYRGDSERQNSPSSPRCINVRNGLDRHRRFDQECRSHA